MDKEWRSVKDEVRLNPLRMIVTTMIDLSRLPWARSEESKSSHLSEQNRKESKVYILGILEGIGAGLKCRFC